MKIIKNMPFFAILAAFGLSMLTASSAAIATEQQVKQCYLDVKYKDFKKALDTCLVAAETGDAGAQLEYGSLFYFDYKEVPKDYDKTKKWISKSADQGNASAEHTMGEIYDFGLGVEPDKELAFSWYKKAANQRIAGAQINVGIMYFDGTGTPADKVLAYTWIKVAVHRAGDMAQGILDEMAGSLNDTQIATASTNATKILTRLYPPE